MPVAWSTISWLDDRRILMATFLGIVDEGRECEGCGLPVGPIAGWTEDMLPNRLVPICNVCLYSFDQRLWSFAMLPKCLDVIIRLAQSERDPMDLAVEIKEIFDLVRGCRFGESES